jgi:hypothetical protein
MNGEDGPVAVLGSEAGAGRNARTRQKDPPIIVRDRRADPPHDWFMAQEVRFPAGWCTTWAAAACSSSTDGPVEFEGLKAGIDPGCRQAGRTDRLRTDRWP